MLIVAANDNGGLDDVGRCAVLFRRDQWRTCLRERVHVLRELRTITAVDEVHHPVRYLCLRRIFRKYYAFRISVSVSVST